MKRSPMKRTGFKRRAQPERVTPVAKPLERMPSMWSPANEPVYSALKVVPVVSERYRRLVALLPCKICGIEGYSQAAHPNTGKGTGTKTDDRLCFPLCCDRPGVRGCHPRFDQGALFTKADRRAVEPEWGADTRRKIIDLGLWPAGLARLED